MSKRRRRVHLAGLVLFLAPTAVLAATVKGKVANTQDLLNPVWNEAKDPAARRYTFREPASTVPPDARILRGHLSKELCLVALADGAEKLKTPIRIKIEGGRLSFVTLVVAPGQEIRFENHDPTPHAIYDVSGQGGLSKGATMNADASRTWTPPGPGKYEIRDELSPSLRAWIVVEPKAAKIAYPNRKGEFAMDLEPGSYELRAYHNGEPVGEPMPIEVKPAPAEQPLKDAIKAGADKKKDEGKDGDAKKDEPDKAGG
jgi:plastocyanin